MKKKEVPIIILVLIVIIVLVLIFDKKGSEERVIEDVKGVVKVIDTSYDIFDISDSYVIAKSNNLYGVVDLDGNVYVPFEYEYISFGYKDYFLGRKENKYFLIDHTGKVTLESDADISKLIHIDGKGYYAVYENDKSTVYLEDGTKYKTYNSSYLSSVGQYIVSDKVADKVDGSNSIAITDYYPTNDNYVLFINNHSGYYYDLKNDELTFYDSVKIDGNVIVVGDDYRFNLYGDELDKDYTLNVGNYYLDYKGCKYGFTLEDNSHNQIDKVCYTGYTYRNGVLMLYREMDATGKVILKNGDVLESNESEWYYLEGNIMIHSTDLEHEYFDLEHNQLDLECDQEIIYANGFYRCSVDDGVIFLDESFKQVGNVYDSILCNPDGICIVEKDHLYGLSYKAKEITKVNYPSLQYQNDYYFVDGIFSNQLLEIGTENILDDVSFEYRDDYKSVSVEDIIKEYKLEDMEDDILKHQDLFQKYAYIVLNNEGLEKYHLQLFKMFKIVLLNIDEMDEYSFLSALDHLSIIEKKLSNAAGLYYDSGPYIELGETIDTVVYHELMHFMDYRLTRRDYAGLYQCGDDYLELSYPNNLKPEYKKCVYSYIQDYETLLVEGGSEYYTAKYITNHNLRTYRNGTLTIGLLSYLYGEDVISDIYYDYNSIVKLFLLLHKDGMSLDDYNHFMEVAFTNVDAYHTPDYRDNSRLIKYLVQIYNNKSDRYWYTDKEFMYILSSVKGYYSLDQSIVGNDIYSHFKTFDYEMFFNQFVDHYSIYTTPFDYMLDDGKSYIIAQVYDHTAANYDARKGYLVVEYDFEQEKVISHEFYLER